MSLPGEFNQNAMRYTADDGQVFTVSQKRANAVAVGNRLVPRGNAQGTPERWRLRYVLIVTIYGGKFYKRKIVIGDIGNPVFQGLRSTINLDGANWMVVTRKGESSRG